MYHPMHQQICLNNMRMKEFKITKREILCSVVIVALMLIVGSIISNTITNHMMEERQDYDTALQVNNNAKEFQYGMKTDIGNAFVYGELKAVDTVSYSAIKGEYMYISKITERYTQHTRVETYTDGNGHMHTRTVTYWSWDEVDRDSKTCKQVKLLNTTFSSKKINIKAITTDRIDTITIGDLRYKYYGIKPQIKGTVYTSLQNNTITDNSRFYKDLTINKTIERLESNFWLIMFWVGWCILIGVVVFIFCYFDNKWLED